MLVQPNSIRRLLERATAQYEASLEGSPANLYLSNRSLTKEVQKSFRLGFVESPLPGHEAYTGRLAIPYLTRSGVVDIRFRSIPPDGDPARAVLGMKYLSMPGATSRPFNTLALARQESFVVICEGEIDTMTAHMAGIPAVGFPGAKTWDKHVYWRMFRYRRVAILADNDDKGAGESFARKVAESIPGSVIISMPEDHDVNSFVSAFGTHAEGVAALRKKVGLS